MLFELLKKADIFQNDNAGRLSSDKEDSAKEKRHRVLQPKRQRIRNKKQKRMTGWKSDKPTLWMMVWALS